jgi:hypothetical protein
MFFEDNTFNWDSNYPSNVQGALYGQYGGKAVFRHNKLQANCTYVDAHGDQYPDTGTIMYEIYSNEFDINYSTVCNGAADVIGMRGGQLIAHDNTFNEASTAMSTMPIGMTVYYSSDTLSDRVKNTYIWNNSAIWTGGSDSNQADLAYVFNSAGAPSASICSSSGCIELNFEYFLNSPQPGQVYYPYAPYTYPHPLTNGNSSAPASPTGLIGTVM